MMHYTLVEFSNSTWTRFNIAIKKRIFDIFYGTRMIQTIFVHDLCLLLKPLFQFLCAICLAKYLGSFRKISDFHFCPFRHCCIPLTASGLWWPLAGKLLPCEVRWMQCWKFSQSVVHSCLLHYTYEYMYFLQVSVIFLSLFCGTSYSSDCFFMLCFSMDTMLRVFCDFSHMTCFCKLTCHGLLVSDILPLLPFLLWTFFSSYLYAFWSPNFYTSQLSVIFFNKRGEVWIMPCLSNMEMQASAFLKVPFACHCHSLWLVLSKTYIY